MTEPYGYADQSGYNGMREHTRNNKAKNGQMKAFYSVDLDKDKNAIFFYDNEGKVQGELSLANIIPSIVEKAWYNAKTHNMYVSFGHDKVVEINVNDIINKNKFDKGLETSNDKDGKCVVNVKVKDGDKYLTVNKDGISADNITTALEEVIDASIRRDKTLNKKILSLETQVEELRLALAAVKTQLDTFKEN